jgi:arylsulfatase A-like enzyme
MSHCYSWPGAAWKAFVRHDCGQIDLAPTITALAGLPAAADWHGRSRSRRRVRRACISR